MKSTASKELGILFIAAVFGIIGGGVALVMYEVSFVWALVVAGIVAIIVALVLWLGWREPAPRELGARPLGPDADVARGNVAQRAGTAGVAPGSAGSDAGSAGVAAGSAPAAAETSVVADTPEPSRTADTSASTYASEQDASAMRVMTHTQEPPRSDDTPVSTDAPDQDASAMRVGPSSRLPGQEDLAARKGEWRYAPDGRASGTAPSEVDATTDSGSPVEAKADFGAEGASAVEAQPMKTASAQPQEAPASEAGATPDTGAPVTARADPGTAGASEAQARPGSDTDVATPSGAAVSTGTHYATQTASDSPTEADKPAMLDSAREGGPDNLKEIKGVGPKLEVMLNGMGIYHFDQIAGWTDRELAWVDDNLTGFKGRASRDEWVSQAKVLADGGDTEFSKRVDKGGVY